MFFPGHQRAAPEPGAHRSAPEHSSICYAGSFRRRPVDLMLGELLRRGSQRMGKKSTRFAF